MRNMNLISILALIFTLWTTVGEGNDDDNKIENNVWSTPYQRSVVETFFPGFGNTSVFLMGDNGQILTGYLGKPPSAKYFFNSPINKAVYFTLYTRQRTNGTNVTDASSLKNSTFDPTKRTKFITHGWMSSGTSDNCLQIKDHFLQMYDYNVIVVDWSAIAKNVFYYVPASETKNVAGVYGDFLNELLDVLGANAADVHLIGHSLGAHVSGFAARRASRQIGRVTGLDPALPLFWPGHVMPVANEKDRHMRASDAAFVDVIHTCSGYLGFSEPIGHADFYPNGGTVPQPGCNLLQTLEACSHSRSWKLFSASIGTSTHFMATKCKLDTDVKSASAWKTCNGERIPMGDRVPASARGIYHLATREQYPYY